MMLADILVAAGKLERAETAFRALAPELPGSAEIPAALGVIALRRGRQSDAMREFQRAIDLGIGDASVCYRFAVLADTAGLPEAAVRAALGRALELKPDFDDARYKLALLEKNAGHDETALAHLAGMRVVAPDRAFAYWTATADALIQLGRRDEAVAAARRAATAAANTEERRRADELAYVAQTDVTVRFTRDLDGNLKLATARTPHGATDWNPFIEPGDRIRRVRGRLTSVECGGEGLSLAVETDAGPQRLAIPDPSHVQMRNAPSEFICGPQSAEPVTVVYAAVEGRPGVDGIVRGVEFQ
jgi:tetratricopeptide (TPR) repeat protein